MSEVGQKIYGAAKAVESAMGASLKDLEGGIGSFLSGGNAKDHEPEPVREARPTEPAAEVDQERTASGQVIANQEANGTPAYLVQTENARGEPEKILLEKGDRDFSIGQGLTLTWGKDGQLAGVEEDRDYGR